MFVSAAEHSSFTEAGRELHIVQSAVSYNISMLEREIGCKLFVRGSRSIRLTTAGELLLKDARYLMEQFKQFERKHVNLSHGIDGCITIAYYFPQSVEPLRDKIFEFQQEHPSIELRFQLYDITNIEEKLAGHLVDVVIIHAVDVEHMKAVKWRKLYSEKYKLILYRGHPLYGKDTVNLRDVANEKFILFSKRRSPSHFFKLTDLFLRADNFVPDIVDEPETTEMIMLMVSLQMGLSILPASWCERYKSDQLWFADIGDPQAFRENGMAWHTRNTNPALSVFLEKDWSVQIDLDSPADQCGPSVTV
jgi:DNA-binding transcriptional LysR family regulator